MSGWLGQACVSPLSPRLHPRPGGVCLTFQVLDDAAQAIAMGCDEHSLAGLDLRGDLLIPEGQGPGDGVLETLTRGQLPRLQACVPPLLGCHTAVQSPRPPDPGSLPKALPQASLQHPSRVPC